jgi:small ligand-binding sensory domain FIST
VAHVTRIAAGLSTAPGTAEAGAEAARTARGGLAAEADLAFVFLSPAHLEDAGEAVEAVESELEPRHLLGCVAEAIVGGDRELEEGPAAVVWAGSLPGAEIELFHAVAVGIDEGVAVSGFPELDEPALVTVLVDPYTFPAAPFLSVLNERHPRLPLVGGIAVGAREPGRSVLVVDGQMVHEGMVGAVLSGVPVRTVVSQGCAPIGRDAVITRAEGNIVYELAGMPAAERLREDIEQLPPDEQLLAAQGLLAGLVIDENKPVYERGDFLMRGLLGADEESGAIAVGEPVRVGQTLRFHVRDANSADADLRQALDDAVGQRGAAGALLFTCNGRGSAMFEEPDHDARALAAALGNRALAGFFCGGEIGPVGGRSFLHGFTATMAVFPDAD